jgi:predicted transcriptional regulator YheO
MFYQYPFTFPYIFTTDPYGPAGYLTISLTFTFCTICTNIQLMTHNELLSEPSIQAVVPLVEGIVKMLHPYAEGAIHDIKQGKIVALYNNISKRKVGDPSVVTELGVDVKDFPDVFDPYYKTNWDGRKLKCTSATIRDEHGTPIGLVCINFDTTVFENMNVQLDTFLTLHNQSSLNPVEQFAVDWKQQVTEFINSYTITNNIALSALTKEEKSDLVKQLYSHGLFNYREAANYIAKILSVSRTTIYNYLKEDKE